MRIINIHHVSIIVADTARSLTFYRDIFELAVSGTRPELGFRGAWLDVGEQQIHLLEVPNPDGLEGRPEHVGCDRHLALIVEDIDSLTQRLQQAGIAYTKSRSGRNAVFCRDPDGNGIELIAS
ncbi:MAG: VOC family protein [Gammaproteobacteria bacterium]|nr:VOC family protein [Gammaproteobacteria bacterium]